MPSKIRWGTLGCGSIARKFIEDMAYSKYGVIHAVGSRSAARSKTFAQELNVPKSHGSYEDLVANPEVDIVYVATPHPVHMEHTLLALKAGKPVLCEKPVSMNARQLKRMITAAKDRRLFFMEGMWTRFFPALQQVRKWLLDKAVGNILSVQADFGIAFKAGPSHRIHNPQLGGGGTARSGHLCLFPGLAGV